MGMQKVAPDDQRCLALIDGINGEQCSRHRRPRKTCCTQHDGLIYVGPKILILADGDDRDPYAEGADAGMESDNPYPMTSNQALSWNDGFCSTHGGEDD